MRIDFSHDSALLSVRPARSVGVSDDLISLRLSTACMPGPACQVALSLCGQLSRHSLQRRGSTGRSNSNDTHAHTDRLAGGQPQTTGHCWSSETDTIRPTLANSSMIRYIPATCRTIAISSSWGGKPRCSKKIFCFFFKF